MSSESFEEFKKRWAEKSELIKKQSFDRDQCFHISMDLVHEISELNFENLFKREKFTTFDLQKIVNDLDMALEIAYSNFRKETRRIGFWAKLFGGNKEVNLIKIK
jgi:hypothetical protein